MKYLAYNKITEKYHIISLDDTYVWPNPINVQWDGIIGFVSYMNWSDFYKEWDTIKKV